MEPLTLYKYGGGALTFAERTGRRDGVLTGVRQRGVINGQRVLTIVDH